VVALACFVNIILNGFCYDDNPIVRHNPKVNDPGQWGAIWTTDYWSEAEEASPNRDLLFRPVALSSYRLVRALGGSRAWPHHVVNLILHAGVCIMVVMLCRRVGGTKGAAWTAGLLFAVLPIHTEAVASIAGRADLLATTALLLAVLSHDRSLRASSTGPLVWWRVGAAVAAFVAVGSKEAGATVVPIVVLFDWHAQRGTAEASLELSDSAARTGDESTACRDWPSPVLRAAWRLAYLIIPATLYIVLRYHALGNRLYQQPPLTKTVNLLVDAPAWQHALGVLQCFGMYWVKTIWPAVLSIKYSINAVRPASSALDPHVLIGTVALVGLVVASVAAWWRGHRAIVVLCASLVVSYLPTANALVLIQVFFAERIWYLPSVFLVVLAGLALGRFVERPVWRVLLVVVLVAMVARCWVRNAEWKNNGTLYAAAYRDQPDGVGALHLYGAWLVDHGSYERGVGLLERAIEIDLGFTDAHRALGQAHLRAGNLPAALRHLQIADYQVPGHPSTAEAFTQVSQELAEQDDALARLLPLADEAPDDFDVHLALVRRLRELGLVSEAVARLRGGESYFAGVPEWQLEYAVTLVYLDDRDGAIGRYRRGLDLAPDKQQAAVELAMLLLERRGPGDLDEAERWAQHASELAPESPTVLACRAELTALRGDLRQARVLYDRAIQALPSDAVQRRVFEERARALGR
jgi:tetratricopeptide (TPR) repeat protein